MSSSYKAKVLFDGSKLTFEINEEMEFQDAYDFAKKSVSHWLETHQNILKDSTFEVIHRNTPLDLTKEK